MYTYKKWFIQHPLILSLHHLNGHSGRLVAVSPSFGRLLELKAATQCSNNIAARISVKGLKWFKPL